MGGHEISELIPGFRNFEKFLKHGVKKINEIKMVAPTGFEPVFQP